MFKIALEVITSIGVGMVVFGIALQHQLKNIAAGIGVFLNPDINVGDSIKINETHGIIIELQKISLKFQIAFHTRKDV